MIGGCIALAFLLLQSPADRGTAWAARIDVCRAIAKADGENSRDLMKASLAAPYDEPFPSDQLERAYRETLELLDASGDNMCPEDPLPDIGAVKDFEATSALWGSWFARHEIAAALTSENPYKLADACESLLGTKEFKDPDARSAIHSRTLGTTMALSGLQKWLGKADFGATRGEYLWRKRALEALEEIEASTRDELTELMWKAVQGLDQNSGGDSLFWGTLSLAEAIGRDEILNSLQAPTAVGPARILVLADIGGFADAKPLIQEIEELWVLVPDSVGEEIKIESRVLVEMQADNAKWLYRVHFKNNGEARLRIAKDGGPKMQTSRGLGFCASLPPDSGMCSNGEYVYDSGDVHGWSCR